MLQEATPVSEPTPQPANDRREIITLREASERSGVPYDTLLRWLSKGLFPYVVRGPFKRKYMYVRDVEDLDKHVPAEFPSSPPPPARPA